MSIKQLRDECINTLKKIPDNASEREIGYTIAIIHLIKIIDEKYSKLLISETSDDEEIEATIKYSKNICNNDVSLNKYFEIFDAFTSGIKWHKEKIKK
jgi:hypothetical protein